MAKPNLSPAVSLYNLNQVYTELNNRIDSLNKIWSVKGTCTWSTLKGKTGTTVGEVWNVSDTDDWGINGGNWTWTTTEPDSSINSIKVGSGWWERLGSILEYASPDAAGVAYVFTSGSATDGTAASSANGNSAANTSSGTINRGVYTVNNTLYTTIPVASSSTYGVVTNQSGQAFSGEKTFNNGIIVNGTISTPAGSTAAMAITGNTVAGTANVGNLNVTNTLDVTGADTTSGTAKPAAKAGTLDVTNSLTVTGTALTSAQWTARGIAAGADGAAVVKNFAVPSGTLAVSSDSATAAKTVTFDSKGLLTSTQTGASTASTSVKTLTVSSGTLAVSSNSATAAKTVYLDVAGTTSVTDTTAAVFGLTTKTLSVPNGTLLVNGSNLTSTQWNAYSGVSGIATDAAAILNNLYATTANIDTLSMSNKTLTVKNDTLVNTLTIPNGTITANSANVDTLMLNTSADGTGTGKKLTVKTDTTVNTLSIASGTITTPAANVGNLTLNTANNNTLTVKTNTTVNTLSIASGTISTLGTVSVGNLTLYGRNAQDTADEYKELTVKTDTTVNTLTGSSATLTVNGTAINVNNLTVNNGTLSATNNGTAVTVQTLDASGKTISITDTATAKYLTASTGTISVGTSATADKLVGPVTSSNPLTYGAVPTISITSGGTVTAKNLTIQGVVPGSNPEVTDYLDLTVKTDVTANALTIPSGTIAIQGQGNVNVENLTLSDGASTPTYYDLTVSDPDGVVAGHLTGSNLIVNGVTTVGSLNVANEIQANDLILADTSTTPTTYYDLIAKNTVTAGNLYGITGSGSAVPAIWLNAAAKINNLTLYGRNSSDTADEYKDLTVKDTVTTNHLYGINTNTNPHSSKTSVSEIWVNTAAKVDNLILSDGSTYKDLTVNTANTIGSLKDINGNNNATVWVNTAAKVNNLILYGRNGADTADEYKDLTLNTANTISHIYGGAGAGNASIWVNGVAKVKDLILSDGASTPTYYDLTVTSAVTASALTASNATVQVMGSGAAVTVGTLNAGITGSTANSTFFTVGDTECTTAGINKAGASTRETGTFSTTVARLKVYGGIRASGGIQAYKVYNAVWNDLADLIPIDCKPEPGYAYSFDGKHYHKTTKYMDQGYIGIESDTSGFEMGGKGAKYELNASVAGFVLAYVDKEYKPGTPLTVTKNGKLTKIGVIGRILHPEMVIATFWKKEPEKLWGPEESKREVNGRMWVKIK